MTDLTIRPVQTECELEECLRIREAVFTGEKAVPREIEQDERDTLGSGCEHFLLLSGGVPAGTLRCTIQDGAVRLQRFCLLPAFRGQGNGRRALELLEQLCRSRGERRIELDAKLEAGPFYEKCGYRRCSDVFLEAGIPHVAMYREL
ncbi:MAG: GNAT family N-acetyltransferase [Clostridiales bacterium]|nr:GNAT family N-acetyltransferase [Clostridiales bacterium]